MDIEHALAFHELGNHSFGRYYEGPMKRREEVAR